MTPPPARKPNKRHRFWGFVLFGLPLLLWMVVLFYGSGEKTRYETSWLLIQKAADFLCPEFAPPGGTQPGQPALSMYQINGALRRAAHIAGYAALSCLTVRYFQAGAPKLKRRSLVAALVVSVLYTGGDELHRAFEPNRHTHWLDLGLNLAGTVGVLSGTILFFLVKQWETAWAAQSTETETREIALEGENKTITAPVNED